MSAPNPFDLTNAPRLPPARLRGQSRSPSRSPLRKAQFAAREIDPLLSNLSPDSTLKALQATATITSEGSGQDALAKSIAEATPAEREIGIRAAVAAQKLKEWHNEVSRWPWPARRARGWGAGFLPPQKSPGSMSPVRDPDRDVTYLGSLPTLRVKEYQEKIEDIRDGIEALELEDVKDHVFSAHIPQRSVSARSATTHSISEKNVGYGRMRDFTALVTATVIQALPELANLTILLDKWDVRLSILKQIPDITLSFKSTRAGIQTAYSVVRSTESGPLVTMKEYETTKNILGAKVASLGSRIDKLLDLLEGQEDSLPKIWIDALEEIENDYAAWVVEAEHVAIRNILLAKALAEQTKSDELATAESIEVPVTDVAEVEPKLETDRLDPVEGQEEAQQSSLVSAKLPTSNITQQSSIRRKPLQQLIMPRKPPLTTAVPPPRHNRGPSEISMAESTLSAMSGISTAEIIDAKSTQVLTSPAISIVDGPFKTSNDELSLASSPMLDSHRGGRPPMLQRASTAAIEVISRDSVKEVVLTRSRSHDMLKQISPIYTPPTTASQALQQLSGTALWPSPPPEGAKLTTHPAPLGEHLAAPIVSSSTTSPTPSLRVEPLRTRARDVSNTVLESPAIPRRSSKRLSQILHVNADQTNPLPEVVTPEGAVFSRDTVVAPRGPTTADSSETLEAKIKDILGTMPTKIQLNDDSDSDGMVQAGSLSSTQYPTPVPTLTLSPVKADRASRQTAPGDGRHFYLTRSGEARDSPPVKLFVRAVGEHGERVMVRVGGGWADLAEYLREYSLHHGHRGIADGNLEVASFPAPQGNQRDLSTLPVGGSTPVRAANVAASASPKRRSFPGTLSTPEDFSTLNVGKTRRNGRGGNGADTSSQASTDGWTPPPVPPIPVTYTRLSPTTVTTTINGITQTGTFDPINSSLLGNARVVSAPMAMLSSTDGRSTPDIGVTTNTYNGNGTYTPLGAAGPISNGRRSVAPGMPSNTDQESWVAGMVGKARAVSSNTTTIYGPTITTTTTVTSRSMPRSVRTSAMPSLTSIGSPMPVASPGPASSPGPGISPVSSGSLAPTGSPAFTSSDNSESKVSPPPARSKNRMSLGDVGGIRRVFLRRKSDKQS